MRRVTLDRLNAASQTDFVSTLANVFEHSPWIAEAAFFKRPFATVAGLRDALMEAASSISVERCRELIKAHPDLANKTQRAAGLTADSVAEQDGAGLDRLSDAEFAVFQQLNDAYKLKFDFPFIACVKRHTKDSILDMFRERLENTASVEQERAFSEIKRIATLRIAQLIEGPDVLAVHGKLSTHVLDTRDGKPASGIAIELVELSRLGDSRIITTAVTNDEGRTDVPLIHSRPLPMGVYELRFDVGAYFVKKGVAWANPAFLEIIPIRFGISEPEAHLHVPLLVTPWSYATYRGS